MAACGDVGPAAPPTVTVASYVLADLDTGAVLAVRAPHERQRPASTLKILTSLVALRSLDPDQMADTAGRLGAFDTRPATPSGLDGPGMATSAYDLALVFRAAMHEPLFAATIATRQAPFPGYADHPGFVVSNTDQFLADYPGAIAGKSGFTDGARHTLVVAAQRGGHRLLAVLFRGEQRPVPMWKQAAALLDEGFALPSGMPAVGRLVDGPPAPAPATPAADAGPPSAAPTTGGSAALPVGVAAVAGIAAVAVAASWWRRKRVGGPPS